MKIRFIIYSSLLFSILTIYFNYKTRESIICVQEITIREQKKNWYDKMANIEFDFAKAATNKYSFWFHYVKGCEYALSELAMIRQDLEAEQKALEHI